MDSKKILYFILTGIVLYIGIQLKDTYAAVNNANKTFYASNHPYAVKLRKQKEPQDTSIPIKASGFQARFVTLKGTINPHMTYKVESIYEATLDIKSCKKRSYSLFSPGVHPFSESFEYKPTIRNNYHSIKVPLDVFDPNVKCKFKLKYVRLIIQDRENAKGANSLYLFANINIINDIYERFYKIAPPTKQADGNFHIDMECIEPSPFSQARYNPCGYKPLSKRNSILHIIPQQSANYVINIDKLPLESIKGAKLDKIIGEERDLHRSNYHYSKKALKMKTQNGGKCGSTNRIRF